ncbi:Hypothetical_protein [Hexamita inflata]|uniref:Hypothetical_protein n=1 Tax=Hexamita inflata TaxID=28002 RepID=A0AA86NJV6_9EUKA|nr:Hypothetical protein HINF_LOCUS8785 [Hexamita inflata]
MIYSNISQILSTQSIINNTIYTKTQDLQQQLTYANTSLNQYITNVQSSLNTFRSDQTTSNNNQQQQINSLFNTKANAADYYVKGQIDSAFTNIQNQINALSNRITNSNAYIQNGYCGTDYRNVRQRVCAGGTCTPWLVVYGGC